MIFNLMKPVPTTESATMYLYGHEADKTVTYNGVELPELPEWDKTAYPYAVIQLGNIINPNKVRLFALKELNFSGLYLMCEGDFLCTALADHTADGFAWGELEQSDSSENISRIHLLWANVDIRYPDDFDEEMGGTVYLSATDPITTYENADVTINGVGYVGAVLPKLPTWDKEQYPYAVIWKMSEENAYLLLSTTEFQYAMLNGLYYLSPTADGSLLLYRVEDLAWTRDEEYDGTFSIDNAVLPSYNGSLVWADYDVNKKYDGSVFLEATAPVPVYE